MDFDSPSASRASRGSHNERLPAGSPAFLPPRRRLLVPKARASLATNRQDSSSESEKLAKSSRCSNCGHLLMDSVFCRNCGQRRAGGLDMAAAFDAVRSAVSEEQAQRATVSTVLHSLEAVAAVVQEMLQVKYGLVLDDADLFGKLRHHCNGATPEEVVALFNSQVDLHFRTRGCQRLLALKLDWKVVDFVQLRTRVRAMPGTASAVAVVREAPYLESGVPTAVAVFREAYGASHEMPCTLMGRCGGPSAPPLLSLSSRELQHAGLIEPRILSELRTTGPSKKPVERTAPPWRDEYVSATKAEDLGLTEAREAREPRAPSVPKLDLSEAPRKSRRPSPRRKEEREGSSATSSARLTQCSTEASRSFSPDRQRQQVPAGNIQVLGPGLALEPPTGLRLIQEPLHPAPFQVESGLPATAWVQPQAPCLSGLTGLTPPTGVGAMRLEPVGCEWHCPNHDVSGPFCKDTADAAERNSDGLAVQCGPPAELLRCLHSKLAELLAEVDAEASTMIAKPNDAANVAKRSEMALECTPQIAAGATHGTPSWQKPIPAAVLQELQSLWPKQVRKSAPLSPGAWYAFCAASSASYGRLKLYRGYAVRFGGRGAVFLASLLLFFASQASMVLVDCWLARWSALPSQLQGHTDGVSISENLAVFVLLAALAAALATTTPL
ncbi:aroB' [Symbiodinium natans]|uniref:AroB' protein n=1 Tax=Symbiodinium natans TaxID=878477 RepID=A0A812G9G0_9DINO|nr:aroB' [Symbiodinium natans]